MGSLSRVESRAVSKICFADFDCVNVACIDNLSQSRRFEDVGRGEGLPTLSDDDGWRAVARQGRRDQV